MKAYDIDTALLVQAIGRREAAQLLQIQPRRQTWPGLVARAALWLAVGVIVAVAAGALSAYIAVVAPR